MPPRHQGPGLYTKFVIAIIVAALACAAFGALFVNELLAGSDVTAAITAVLVVSSIVGVIILFKRLLIKPLKDIDNAINRVLLGDLSQLIPTDSDGDFVGLGGKFNEMTRQLASSYRGMESAVQTSREEEARLESSLFGLEQGFVMTNPDNKVIMINPAGMKMLRLRKTDSLPAEFDNVTRNLPASLGLGDKIAQVLNTRKPAHYTDISVGERFFNLYLSPVVSDGEVIGSALLFDDVTKSKELERMKTELVTLASHQLRTPAAAVKMDLSLLLDGYLGSLTDEQIKGLREAYNENQYEISLVDDIIAVSELETNGVLINPTVVNLTGVIKQIVSNKAGAVSERELKIQVKVPENITLEADESKIYRIFESLLDNAIKYSKKGGKVSVAAKKAGSFVTVEFSDSGVGIPKNEVKNLFQKFYRGSNAVKINMAGPGLGLFIAKSLVELHRGQINVKTKLGSGSTFKVKLPIKFQNKS